MNFLIECDKCLQKLNETSAENDKMIFLHCTNSYYLSGQSAKFRTQARQQFLVHCKEAVKIKQIRQQKLLLLTLQLAKI